MFPSSKQRKGEEERKQSKEGALQAPDLYQTQPL